ncbi:hypothetical protein ACIQOV_05280 [Kitasatospora sp. NPDC091257]|uniref:hypothetical protein n=1 Tax=Kitasatospora sp. NPDC091257 TaxID=3364084 RepID=UPI0037F93CFE
MTRGEAGRRRAWPAVVALAAPAAAGAPVVWAWSLDRPVGAGPLWLCAAALAVGTAASVRPGRGADQRPDRRAGRRTGGGGDAAVRAWAVVLLAAAWGTAFATAQAVHTVQVRAHEPRSVAAVVTHCRATGQRPVEGGGLGSKTYGCTYRWSVDGQEFSEERPVDEPYPDGHEVRVGLEDGGRMVTGRPSPAAVPFWIVLALLGLAAVPYAAVRLAAQVREADR